MREIIGTERFASFGVYESGFIGRRPNRNDVCIWYKHRQLCSGLFAIYKYVYIWCTAFCWQQVKGVSKNLRTHTWIRININFHSQQLYGGICTIGRQMPYTIQLFLDCFRTHFSRPPIFLSIDIENTIKILLTDQRLAWKFRVNIKVHINKFSLISQMCTNFVPWKENRKIVATSKFNSTQQHNR